MGLHLNLQTERSTKDNVETMILISIQKTYEWLSEFSKSDWILSATLIVLIWYSIETHLLRSWQKKQVQLAIFNAEVYRFKNHQNLGGLSFKFPMILRKIYELGKLDLRELYCDKQPIRWKDKFFAWTKRKLNR